MPFSSDPEFNRFFPDDFALETPRVIMRPLVKDDEHAFLPLVKSANIWKFFNKDLHTETELTSWVDSAIAERTEGKRMPFTIIDKSSKEICGSSSYGSISFYDKRIEIGWSWLGEAFMGTGVNKQAKFALLSYAFEVMKMERVEVKTDNLNERAKAALIKVGMKPEGILRSHTLMHSNRRRDTIYFSIIREEWKERKEDFFPELL